MTVDSNDKAELEIDEMYGGGIDMRCAVGHLTRSIKIFGSNEDGLGGHM